MLLLYGPKLSAVKPGDDAFKLETSVGISDPAKSRLRLVSTP